MVAPWENMPWKKKRVLLERQADEQAAKKVALHLHRGGFLCNQETLVISKKHTIFVSSTKIDNLILLEFRASEGKVEVRVWHAGTGTILSKKYSRTPRQVELAIAWMLGFLERVRMEKK